MAAKCSGCGSWDVRTARSPDGGNVQVCATCGATLDRSGLRVEGRSWWQVLIVMAALILLMFGLAVVWKLFIA